MQVAKLVLLMRKRYSVRQEENCSHAQSFFAILYFSGITIPKTVALTLLIILIRNSHDGFAYRSMFVYEILLKSLYYKYANHLYKSFYVFKALQCILR